MKGVLLLEDVSSVDMANGRDEMKKVSNKEEAQKAKKESLSRSLATFDR